MYYKSVTKEKTVKSYPKITIVLDSENICYLVDELDKLIVKAYERASDEGDIDPVSVLNWIQGSIMGQAIAQGMDFDGF